MGDPTSSYATIGIAPNFIEARKPPRLHGHCFDKAMSPEGVLCIRHQINDKKGFIHKFILHIKIMGRRVNGISGSLIWSKTLIELISLVVNFGEVWRAQ